MSGAYFNHPSIHPSNPHLLADSAMQDSKGRAVSPAFYNKHNNNMKHETTRKEEEEWAGWLSHRTWLVDPVEI